MKPLSSFASSWSTLSPLLDEALGLPAHERQAWLEGLTDERAIHRGALHALLRHQASVETDDFLNKLPQLDAAATDPSQRPAEGSRVGAYRLIREVGQGGMGTVWLAERADGTMKRHVALKLPRVVWGDNFAERLAREREILATLEHEHIARLYDAGVDAQGRPFLAMEYVEGEPIDAYCRAHATSVRERVALLLQVAAAVAHAHARLIVHRDLKPGNILVTKDARVHLLDFGIAKLLEDDLTSQTALTELVGRAFTLDYASPEQIRGEPLGTASDVYSLAVVAYELLSGSKPYRLKRASAAELEDAIATVEPPLASSSAADPRMNRQLRGDLDSILNKALKKSPGERYRTIDAFADDLRRYLAGEPVAARPDRLAYRATRFAQRHRLQVGAGAVVVMALFVGLSLALWQAREARLQAKIARTEATTAGAVRDFLETIFRANSGDQADADKVRNTTARELLDRGAERINSELSEAPQARLQLLKTLADMYLGLTLLDKAADLQGQRAALALTLGGRRSVEYAQAMADYAEALAVLDRRDEAIRAAGTAAGVLDGLGDHTSAARYSVDHALALADQRNDPEAGLRAAERAVTNARARSDIVNLVGALQVRSEIAAMVGQKAIARDGALEAIHLVEADPRRGASYLSTLYVALADAQFSLGTLREAEASYLRALAIAKERDASQPIKLHTAERRYGSFLRRNGRFRESIDMHRPGYEWARANPDGFGVIAAELVVEYGRALVAYGRVEDGLLVIDQALSMPSEATSAAESTAATHLFRAQGLIELGRLTEAERDIAEAQSAVDPRALHVSPLVAYLHREIDLAKNRPDLALRAFEEERVRQGKPATPASSEPARNWVESARLQLAAGHVTSASDAARQALSRIESDQNRPFLAEQESAALYVSGRAALSAGDPVSARELLSRSLVLRRQVFDPDQSLTVADTNIALADALTATGDRTDAKRLRTEARRVRARHVMVGSQNSSPLSAN